MKTRHPSTFAVIALLLAAAALPVAAQSLLDNQYYKEAQDLLARSQQALDAGDYDGSAALAMLARDQLARSDDYVATMTQSYRANGYLSMAQDRVAYATSIDADTHFKPDYDRAVTAVAGAKTALDEKDFPASIGLSKSAIAALEKIAPVAETPPREPPAQAAQPSLPQYYTVRLLSPRDCFWRIAGYPFVYGNPWKWRLLYDANKDLLADPKDPDIIEPGMRFLIPALGSEGRDGDFDPQAEYPPLTAK